jgi:hypothetical protein
MRAMKNDLSALPVVVLIVLGVVLLIELTLDVIALVDLYRRPIDRVTLGNKWVWVAIIVLVSLLGAILYLAIGRKPAVPSGGETPARPSSAADIADKLYGPRDDSTHP